MLYSIYNIVSLAGQPLNLLTGSFRGSMPQRLGRTTRVIDYTIRYACMCTSMKHKTHMQIKLHYYTLRLHPQTHACRSRGRCYLSNPMFSTLVGTNSLINTSASAGNSTWSPSDCMLRLQNYKYYIKTNKHAVLPRHCK